MQNLPFSAPIGTCALVNLLVALYTVKKKFRLARGEPRVAHCEPCVALCEPCVALCEPGGASWGFRN